MKIFTALFLFTFYSAASIDTTKLWNYFNRHKECEVAGMRSANLFLCDNGKPIKILPALGSLTSPLCVKITLSCPQFMLLSKMCPAAYKQLHRYRQADVAPL